MSFTLDEVEAAGGFPIVYADLAWAYAQGGRGSTDGHYPTMSVQQIQALPVKRLASPNAVLFIWGTWPQLPVVLATIGAWGFTYKTVGFVWVKHHVESGKKCVGGGFWTRANTEFCLIGVRGKEHPTRINKSIRQLIETVGGGELLQAPRGEHSAKPPEARERIVQLMGDVPRIELFARERTPGWECWGNEVDSDVELL